MIVEVERGAMVAEGRNYWSVSVWPSVVPGTAIALIVLGPEKLPRVARTLGHLLGRARSYANQVKQDIDREMQMDELRKLQQEHRGDRQKLNEEMMKLYQEHKVNPLASCFPLLLQFPVFIIMFRVLHGLTYEVTCVSDGTLSPGATELCKGVTEGTKVFYPKFISSTTELYTSLAGKTEMKSWGLDLAKRPFQVIGESFGSGLVYALLVIALGVLYFVQQRMVAARATVTVPSRSVVVCGSPPMRGRSSGDGMPSDGSPVRRSPSLGTRNRPSGSGT